MKQDDFQNTGRFGKELFDVNEPQIETDEFAVEGHSMLDPADQEIDSIVREVMSMEDSTEVDQAELPGVSDTEDVYEDIYGVEEETEVVPYTPSKRKKRRRERPRRKKIKRKGSGLFGIPHFISGLILVALVLVLGVTCARVMWLWADDVLALTKEDREVTITVTDSDTMGDIAQKLADAGLVRYPAVFKFYCKISDSREKISAGEFQLNEMLDYHALVGHMSSRSSSRKEISVTIPEGYECRQIFELLEKNQVCTVKELEKAVTTMDLGDYWFLEEVNQEEGANCLEGFMFPDTYNFYMFDDPERVIKKFLRNFDNRFSDELVEGITELNGYLTEKWKKFGYSDDYIASHYLTIRDVVNVAAMIERETAGSGESATIASVIYNRLCNPNYPYLNIDATIQYALGERKAVLTYEDLQIDSPYNTYRYGGLPVGPISNPGLNSLKAAIWPEDTKYYYYALGNDGVHHFTKTAEEHQAFLDSLKESGDD